MENTLRAAVEQEMQLELSSLLPKRPNHQTNLENTSFLLDLTQLQISTRFKYNVPMTRALEMTSYQVYEWNKSLGCRSGKQDPSYCQQEPDFISYHFCYYFFLETLVVIDPSVRKEQDSTLQVLFKKHFCRFQLTAQ